MRCDDDIIVDGNGFPFFYIRSFDVKDEGIRFPLMTEVPGLLRSVIEGDFKVLSQIFPGQIIRRPVFWVKDIQFRVFKTVAQAQFEVVYKNPHHNFQRLLFFIKFNFRYGNMNGMKVKTQRKDVNKAAYGRKQSHIQR
jgi:hypothetical protein